MKTKKLTNNAGDNVAVRAGTKSYRKAIATNDDDVDEGEMGGETGTNNDMEENCEGKEGMEHNCDMERNRDWPQSKRDKTSKKDFAGPHESFPIVTQADVDSAAKLIGHADDPEAVKAHIKSIAKKKGLKVPDSWTNNEQSNEQSVGIKVSKGVVTSKGSVEEGTTNMPKTSPQKKASDTAGVSPHEDEPANDDMGGDTVATPQGKPKKTKKAVPDSAKTQDTDHDDYDQEDDSDNDPGKGKSMENNVNSGRSGNTEDFDYLSTNGYVHVGGGDDFRAYANENEPGKMVYVANSGSWEYHDFDKQESDDPSEAQAKGRTPAGLKQVLNIKENAMKLSPKQRSEMIAKLVGNCKCQDKETAALNSLSDETLSAMISNAFPPKKKKGEMKDEPDGDEEDSEDEEVENMEESKGSGSSTMRAGKNADNPGYDGTGNRSGLTADERAGLARLAKLDAQHKNRLIRTVVSNEANTFSEKDLGKMDLNTLEKLAKLAVTNKEYEPEADYFGAGAHEADLTDNAAQDQEGLLIPPTINWAKEYGPQARS